jgi:hypothetical protein
MGWVVNGTTRQRNPVPIVGPRADLDGRGEVVERNMKLFGMKNDSGAMIFSGAFA